jgi:hypothetical protein
MKALPPSGPVFPVNNGMFCREGEDKVWREGDETKVENVATQQ